MEASLKTREVRTSSIEEQLEEVSQAIKSTLENVKGIPDEERAFSVDSRYRDVQSKKFQTGSFCFWGGLTQKSIFHMYSTEKDYIPDIKNLRIPESIRKRGLGSKIVKAWEKTLKERGYDVFVATNINGNEIEFWKNLGYTVPFEERNKETPYYMVKDLKSLEEV